MTKIRSRVSPEFSLTVQSLKTLQKLNYFFLDKLVIQENKTNILIVVQKISDSEKDLVFGYDKKQPFLPFISLFHSPSHFR